MRAAALWTSSIRNVNMKETQKKYSPYACPHSKTFLRCNCALSTVMPWLLCTEIPQLRSRGTCERCATTLPPCEIVKISLPIARSVPSVNFTTGWSVSLQNTEECAKNSDFNSSSLVRVTRSIRMSYLTNDTMMPRAPFTKPSSAAVVLTKMTWNVDECKLDQLERMLEQPECMFVWIRPTYTNQL